MRKQHVVITAVAALLATAGLALPAHPTNAQTRAPASAQTRVLDTAASAPPVILRDRSGTSALVIQLQQGRPDTGAFDLHVTGVGIFEGSITPIPDTAQVDHLSGVITVTIFPTTGEQKTLTNIRVAGTIDPISLNASIDAWGYGKHYHFQTDHGNAADAVKATKADLPLLQAGNWSALYPQLASFTQHTYTQAQFVQAMNAQQGQASAIVSVTPSGTGQVKTSPLGYTVYQQPVTLRQRASDGSATTTASNIYLLYEQGAWHFWCTDPSPSLAATLQATETGH